MRNPLLQIAMVLILFGATVPLASAKETGRFSMTKVEDGFLRLDTKTGAVSLCTRKNGKWACGSLDDDAHALEKTIDRLTLENKRLSARVKELERLAGRFGKEFEHSMPEPKLDLPKEEEVDKAMKFVEDMLRRFKGLVERLQEKSPEGTPL